MKLTKIYLAIPYRGIGEENSFEQATTATAKIIKLGGYNVFSPITHSHPLTPYNIKGGWDTWQHYDYQFIDWCDEIWVVIPQPNPNHPDCPSGYDHVLLSQGVRQEIQYGNENNKQIRYVEVNDKGIIIRSNPKYPTG